MIPLKRSYTAFSMVFIILAVSHLLAFSPRPREVGSAQAVFKSALARAPFVIRQQGDTAWIQVHADGSQCPGDPLSGHGGEATGGPGATETWCFEGGPGDSCGSNPPWDTKCFQHVDVLAMPSRFGVNYWHIDSYRADQRPYCGDYCLWCGADSLWGGGPLECDTWADTPGYGNGWNCIVELALDSSFTIADGCTLHFDPRYDTECKYDYFYLEFHDGEAWQELAAFNATSNNPGAECGSPSGGNPDYWSNTDVGQPASCDWQERPDPAKPAFGIILQEWGDSTLLDSVTCAPCLRWSFESDPMFSDQDGVVDTDGGAFIDNVWVCGDAGLTYQEDFEHGSWDTLASRGWSKPDPAGKIDAWFVHHDSDPPYEGGDGHERTSCRLDSSSTYRSRPYQGYPAGAPWRCGWHYRLVSPAVPIPGGNQGSGSVIQYDMWRCCLEYTCDYTDTKVRFYDSEYGCWCPWFSPDGSGYDQGGCFFWEMDREEDLTTLYDASAESLQFAWDAIHYDDSFWCCSKSSPNRRHNLQIDNVSIGFYDGTATIFSARPQDLLHDTFHDSICAHNSFFDEYSADTLNLYSGAPYVPAIPKAKQLYVDIYDKDGIVQATLHGSMDGGVTWQSVTMQQAEPADPSNPGLGGEYYGTLCPTDFGQSRWDKGSAVWYYVSCTDDLADTEYFPAKVDPDHPGHTGSGADYLEFSILPLYPPDYEDPVILLVDGYGGDFYDWAECIETDDVVKSLGAIYGDILRDAGYCYDEFDINAVGIAANIHPIEYSAYDALLWFCGPHNEYHIFNKEAQTAIRDYVCGGGKVVVCGDRVAWGMMVINADSLSGEFLAGVLGCRYCEEMEPPFDPYDRAYVYLEAAETVSVFGNPVPIGVDSLLVYRQCPEVRNMSYVRSEPVPPAGYTTQPLLHVVDPYSMCDPSHGAIYIERETGNGQCVFVDFDLSGFVTHLRTDCSGSVPEGLPPFEPGSYYGRVDLVRIILEDLFGLPSRGPGQGGTSGLDQAPRYTWRLNQNVPNPLVSTTEIAFEVARDSRVSVRIYDITGRCVRTLTDRRYDPGTHYAHWDRTNDAGRRAASGVYFYRMEAGAFTSTRKMLVLR